MPRQWQGSAYVLPNWLMGIGSTVPAPLLLAEMKQFTRPERSRSSTFPQHHPGRWR